MKIYFDNRSYDRDNIVKISIDNIYYGKVITKGLSINGVELPSCESSIRLSFSSILYENEEFEFFDSDVDFKEEENVKILKTFEMSENEQLLIPKEQTPYNGMSKQAWQYPYDVEFDAQNYVEDIVFTPINFITDNLRGCIYYQGKTKGNNEFVKLKLIKRLDTFNIEKHRKNCMYICPIVFIVSLIAFPFALHTWIYDYLLLEDFNGARSYVLGVFGNVVISFLGLIGSLLVFREKWSYSGMFKENEMEDCYYITSNGCLIK